VEAIKQADEMHLGVVLAQTKNGKIDRYLFKAEKFCE